MDSNRSPTASSGYAFSTGDGGVFGTSDLPSQQEGLQQSEKLFADYYSSGPNESVMSTGMNSGSFDEVSNATAANTEASQYNTTSGTEADATSLLESNQMVSSFTWFSGWISKNCIYLSSSYRRVHS